MTAPAAGRFTGCLIGQCLGDAYGFVMEGHGLQDCRPYADQVVRARKTYDLGCGSFPFGQYTDDSQLARELILSLVHCRRLDLEDFAFRFSALFAENRVVGRGLASDAVARRLSEGVPWHEAAAAEGSAGNGTAMRAAPIGLFCWERPQELVQLAHDQGRVTHLDQRCSAGSIAIAAAVAFALRDSPLRPDEFACEVAALAEPFDPLLSEALRQMPRWLAMAPLGAAREISRVGVPPGFEDAWQLISPFVTPSTLWSIYSFLHSPDDYMETIATAIEAGGDVDSTAAMAGAISGAFLGIGAIPAELARLVNDRGTWRYDELVTLSERLHATVVRDSAA